MNLPKAIELLDAIHHSGQYEGDPDDSDAIQLGIEALEWRALMVRSYGSWCGPPLPGETSDE